MYERLTKQDGDLLDYARGLGMRTTSKNSQPQVLIKTKNGVRPHNLLNEKDADEEWKCSRTTTTTTCNSKNTSCVSKSDQ